jgi:quinol monooxygenase YgiN
MWVVVVEFRVRPERVQAFHEAIVSNARESVNNETGCRQFDVCTDPADPMTFFLYEVYDDAAAFDAHLRSPHFLQMNAQVAGWVESKAVRTLQRVPA